MKRRKLHNRLFAVSYKNPKIDANAMEDRISELSNDILVNIISLLTVREAARTELLSKRWKYLWTSMFNLNFDASRELSNIKIKDDTLEEERSNYVNWVTKALEAHRASHIIQFRVCFDLLGLYMHVNHDVYITSWIYAAISKEVQEFELNLHHYNLDIESVSLAIYVFSEECFNYLQSSPGLYSIRNLRSLNFDSVNVRPEILEFFIHNCPLLDRLRVANNCPFLSRGRVPKSSNLNRLKVVGSSIPLKYLEIDRYYEILDVEISTPNLLTLNFRGASRVHLNIKNVPRLVEASINGPLLSFFGPEKSYLQQLHTLNLDLEGSLRFLPCQLPKIRHLALTVRAEGRKSLVGFTHMINACPLLEKLILKLTYVSSQRKKVHKFPKFPHQHLRVVELIGFIGIAIDVEFANYLLENATILENIIVEPLMDDNQSHSSRKDRVKMMLEKIVPDRVKLTIR